MAKAKATADVSLCKGCLLYTSILPVGDGVAISVRV